MALYPPAGDAARPSAQPPFC